MNKNKIKEDLESFAKDLLQKKDSNEFNDEVNRFKEYLEKNKEDLIKIYKEDGPESEYLVSGYKAVYDYPKCALQYQEHMESTIAGDVLVAHDESY